MPRIRAFKKFAEPPPMIATKWQAAAKAKDVATKKPLPPSQPASEPPAKKAKASTASANMPKSKSGKPLTSKMPVPKTRSKPAKKRPQEEEEQEDDDTTPPLSPGPQHEPDYMADGDDSDVDSDFPDDDEDDEEVEDGVTAFLREEESESPVKVKAKRAPNMKLMPEQEDGILNFVKCTAVLLDKSHPEFHLTDSRDAA